MHFLLNYLGEKNNIHIVSKNEKQIGSEQKYSAGQRFNTIASSLSLLNLSHNKKMYLELIRQAPVTSLYFVTVFH